MEVLRIGREVSGPLERTLARLSHLLVSEGRGDTLPTSGRKAGGVSTPQDFRCAYLITASVLASKKWMRSGTKAMRIFSCGFALTDGSTRQTTDWPPTVTFSR